jgi:hypothetical protein
MPGSYQPPNVSTFWVRMIIAVKRNSTGRLICFQTSGVADGVGGWREYGIDPSKFSSSLMETCKRLIEKDKLDLNDDQNIDHMTPIKILSHSYNTLLENKNGLIGKCYDRSTVFGRHFRGFCL